MKRGSFLLWLAALTACSTVPEVGGVRADLLTSDQVLEASERAARNADPCLSAELAEFLLRHDYDFGPRGRVRWLAAEGCFGCGAYESALIHYRRLLDDDPLSARAGEVPQRLWTIGRELVRKRSHWIDDFSSRFDAGVEALQMLVTYFPRHELADDAWRELGIALRSDGLHQAAADCFERLAREYPDGEWTDYALYHVAAEYRSLSRGGSYDVEPLLVAHGALRRYVEKHPDGNFVELAKGEILEVEAEVTAREIEVADYYAFRGNAAGERLHLANAARRFPGAPRAEEARARLEKLGGATAKDSVDLLRPRQDRPRWAASIERGVGEKDAEEEKESRP